MGRGLGPTQRAIIRAIYEADEAMTMSELAEALDRQPRQVRRAVDALARRQLVDTWLGDGRQRRPKATPWRGMPTPTKFVGTIERAARFAALLAPLAGSAPVARYARMLANGSPRDLA